MPSDATIMPTRRAALIAGASYVALFFLAIFANFFVLTGLVDPDSAAETGSNIAESEGLFRAGIVGFLIIFALDVVIAWALYIVFRQQRRDLSLVTAWFRLVYTVSLGVAVIFLFLALQVVTSADYAAVFSPEQADEQAALLLDGFTSAWLIGLLCFGIHVMLLGYLVLSTRVAPRALGVILMIAGAAYVVDTLANAVLSNYDSYADVFLVIVALPAVVAELWFAVWLLMQGGKDAAVERQSALA